MSGQEVAGIAVTVLGLGGFGVLLHLRGRRKGSPRREVRPWQAMASPTGEWIAVVRSGPPFDGRLEFLERLLIYPLPLCRLELAIVRAGPPPAGEAGRIELAGPAVVSQTLWSGLGSPSLATEVRLSWTGPRAAAAALRGTTHRIELPPGA